MEIQSFLPDPLGLNCIGMQLDRGGVVLELAPATPTALCPACGQPARRVHSRYTRFLADLPLMGTPARLHLRVRRFFCDTPACPRRTFVEPMFTVAGHHARKTSRLSQALCRIGLTLGGNAGSRLAGRLGMSASGDTILRLVRRAPPQAQPVVTVLGVDDWAWHKGLRYGTILCDLERHRPVDLLPERSAEDLSHWLTAHPGVHVISRDRGSYYMQGATSGAPQAVQVADRFHLLCNLREALVRALERYRPELKNAAQIAAVSQPRPPPPVLEALPIPAGPAAPPSRAQQAKEASRSRRMERYNQVVALHEQGVSLRGIALRMKMHFGTVRRFLHAGQFPERAVRKYARRTDRFVDYLRQRWEEGCHSAAQLARELAEHGLNGSYDAVRRRVAPWRMPGSPHTTGRKPVPKESSPIRPPSPNQASWLLLGNSEDHSTEENAFVEALWQQCPKLKNGTEMAQEFTRMVHDRKADLLEGWIERMHGAGIPHELAVFADGLLQDHEAVKAALTLEWSNGQVEGQINRLKMIKRQMYGRAGFDLLRQRVLDTG
jgi:transposase